MPDNTPETLMVCLIVSVQRLMLSTSKITLSNSDTPVKGNTEIHSIQLLSIYTHLIRYQHFFTLAYK